MKKLILPGLLLLVLFPWGLVAQTSCSEQLRVAQRRYDEGLLDDIPKLISSCLENGFSKEEKMNAYKLLIQTYLYSDATAMADETMVAFLRDFPEYKIANNDPKEFILLHKSYRTEPIMNIEFSAGGSLSLPQVNEFYGVESLNQETAAYDPLIGVNIGVNYNDKLYKEFDICLGLSLNYLRYGYSNATFVYTETWATFSDIRIGIPISSRYNFKFLGIKNYAFAGVEPTYLISTSVDFTRTLPGGSDPYTGTLNFMDMRNKIDVYPFFGIGSFFRIGTLNFRADARVKFATINHTNNTLRYSKPEIIDKYYYIDDNILVHQVSLSVSYIFSIYKPKKLE
jgi:hypothetical protein